MDFPRSVPPLLRFPLAWALTASLVVHGASLALGPGVPTEAPPPPPVHVELLVKGQPAHAAAPAKAVNAPRETPPTPSTPTPKAPPPPPRPAPLLTRAPNPTQPAPLQLPPQPPEQVAVPAPTPARETPAQPVASSGTAHAPAAANPGGNPGSGSTTGPQGVAEGPDPTPIAWVSNRMPPYPRRALERGLEGVVLVRVEVDTAGRVTDVEVVESSGYALLDEAAREGARGWRYTPPTVAGRPVAGSAKVPVRFTLANSHR